ncbi:hypothetical protein BGX26_002945 [Mortierella sp. AD094]|nr:hypothetical protein BGX26_002945 [Mortierella sp. AD094]
MSKAFPLSASPTDTVGQLKNLIKEKSAPRFDDIPANELALWSVSIPVIAAKKHDPVIIDSLETKDELLPTTRLSKLYPKGVEDDIIHILVQRPLFRVFKSRHIKVVLQRNPPQDFPWSTDVNTTTLAGLEQVIHSAIYRICPDLPRLQPKDGPSRIVIHHPKSIQYPNAGIYYPATDARLREVLCDYIRAGIKSLNVDLETPRKAIADYDTLAEVNDLYGFSAVGYCQLSDIPPLPISMAALDSSDHKAKLERVYARLESNLNVSTPDEAGSSLFIDSLLEPAVELFKDQLTLTVNRQIAGKRGQGQIERVVESRDDGAFLLNVTRVEHRRYERGVAQNMIQQESALASRKRKFDDGEETEVIEGLSPASYGIVTDAENWYFIECKLEDTTPTFRCSKAGNVLYMRDGWRQDAKKMFQRIVWLMERAFEESQKLHKRRKTK